MRKILLLNTLMMSTITILLAVVCLTIRSHKKTIERIAPATEEQRIAGERMGSLRLSEKEVHKIHNQLNRELIQLDNLKQLFTFTIVFIIAISIIVLYKFSINVRQFDGLCLLAITLLFSGILWLVLAFSDGFYGGQNAGLNIRIGVFIGTIIIQPILFYVSYRMNKHEISLHLHNQKWITYIAIALITLSLAVALFIGIGVLITPDLSGNMS